MSIWLMGRADQPPRFHQENWGAALARVWLRWRLHRAQRSERKALRDLADDPHLLDDIGVTREEALVEAEKPFLAIADACTHSHASRVPYV